MQVTFEDYIRNWYFVSLQASWKSNSCDDDNIGMSFDHMF